MWVPGVVAAGYGMWVQLVGMGPALLLCSPDPSPGDPQGNVTLQLGKGSKLSPSWCHCYAVTAAMGDTGGTSLVLVARVQQGAGLEETLLPA